MFPEINLSIQQFSDANISSERKDILLPLVRYIKSKVEVQKCIRLNFICTHNSRRSHLAQVWAQAMAHHFGIQEVTCYSGGTEATAMFEKIVDTILQQGFLVLNLSEGMNPVYAVKFAEDIHPVICFSKTYDHAFNPSGTFAAIMTCSQADEGCPFIPGAEARFAIRYEDPKAYDGTPEQELKYSERSLEIGQEMWWVMREAISR